MRNSQNAKLLRLIPLACLAISMCSCTSMVTQNPDLFGAKGQRNSAYDHNDSADAYYTDAMIEGDFRRNREMRLAKQRATRAFRGSDENEQRLQSPPIQTASYSQPAGVIRFAAAERRIPNGNAHAAIQQVAAMQPGTLQGGVEQLAIEYPDEYLFDGGDRALPIHYDAFRRLGLDTEDTVAEYDDHRGKSHVKASTRVAVYAPRFAAVRTVSHPISGLSLRKAVGAQKTTFQMGLLARAGAATHTRKLQADGVRVRSRAGGLDANTTRVALRQRVVLGRNDKLLNIYENLTFVKTGHANTTEEAFLAARIQAAAAWSAGRFPVISAGLDAIKEVEGSASGQEIVGTDDDHKTDGNLRIVKLADKKAAKSGDIITFTIRYDNLGDRELKNIRIVDNLTPRLEYVEDSATSTRAGRLDVEDNSEGSLVLKFVLDKPLPGKTGGVVTFKAKVR